MGLWIVAGMKIYTLLWIFIEKWLINTEITNVTKL